MINKLLGSEKISILQCEELAKDIGYDSLKFKLCGPKGELNCQWLDAYMGLFKIIGENNFMMSRDFKYANDIWCVVQLNEG